MKSSAKRPARKGTRRSAAPGRVITATEAARSFSALLDRVQHRGEVFIVERGGTVACEIAPVGPPSFRLADLAALLASGPRPDPEYWNELDRLVRDQAPVAPSPWEH